MAFGNVRDYLPQEYIDSILQTGRSRGVNVDELNPFDMSLDQYVNQYRQNQQPYVQNNFGGFTPDKMTADSWFGSLGTGLELPRDASGMWSMPTSEDWRNPQPAFDPMQLGGAATQGTGTHTNFDPNSLLGGPQTPAGPPTTGGGMGAVTRWNSPTVTNGPIPTDPYPQYDDLFRNDGGPGTVPFGLPPGAGTPYSPGTNTNPLTPMNPFGNPSSPPAGGGTNTPAGPGPSTFPTGSNTLGSGPRRLPMPGGGDPDPFADLFGLGPMAGIPDINLGDMPTMAGGWADGFEDAYRRNTTQTAGGIADIFKNLQLPTAQASQINLGSLPQLQPNQVDQSDALKTLLSGQGFAPDVMARINAGATDNISRQAAANRGSSRLALEQSGLAGSPAQAAIEGQINRQRGDATTRALNENAITNADRGLQNFRMGAEMDMGREMGNMQQANAMALAKASQMLTAMSQNAANVQQANMANFGAQNDRQMTSGNRQADVIQGAGTRFGDASIQKQMGADQQNASNRFNWLLNQANLDRGGDITNANLQQGRWNTGISGLLGLAGMQNPLGFSGQGNQLSTQQNPTNLLGSVLSNIGQANTPVTS